MVFFSYRYRQMGGQGAGKGISRAGDRRSDAAGGAGSAAQEVMLAVSDKPTPGIASSAVRGKTLIVYSTEEHMDALMDSAPQVMESLRNGR